MFQRACGAEPLVSLRFSSIHLPKVIEGIATRFREIDNPDLLSFRSSGPGTEYIGHHKRYGLDYHTFKNDGEIDVEKFLLSEASRLGYLARMLMEQIEGAEKTFVIQRQPNLTVCEVLPLLHAMRAYNARVRLLWVTANSDGGKELTGKVEHQGDNLFHGFIDRFAPIQRARQCSFENWIKLCRNRKHNRTSGTT